MKIYNERSRLDVDWRDTYGVFIGVVGRRSEFNSKKALLAERAVLNKCCFDPIIGGRMADPVV